MSKKGFAWGITICLVAVMCGISLSYLNPIRKDNTDEAEKVCSELYITTQNDYITREEFLGMLLSIIGLNDNIFSNYCNGIDRAAPATDDIKEGNQYQIYDINFEEAEKIYKYDTLCYIACEVNILQTYKNTYEYRGKDYITLKDAIVMIEACLEDTNTEKGRFFKQSNEYKRLFNNARKNILGKNDIIYWVPINRKATCEEIYTLLDRLLNQKRYKYLSDTNSIDEIPQIDIERSITYKEYLE